MHGPLLQQYCVRRRSCQESIAFTEADVEERAGRLESGKLEERLDVLVQPRFFDDKIHWPAPGNASMPVCMPASHRF
jgi:hypothetical protein